MKSTKLSLFKKALVFAFFTLVSTASINAQSWMKAFGSTGGTYFSDNYAYSNQFVSFGNKLYVLGEYLADSLISSDLTQKNLLTSDTSRTDFVIQMDFNGKVKHAFNYSGFTGNVIAGDDNGNFIMAGTAESRIMNGMAQVKFPGDTFYAPEIPLVSQGNIISSEAIIAIDSTGHAKWHYIIKYLQENDVSVNLKISLNQKDSAGNSYFFIPANNVVQNHIIIEKDTLWKDQNTDSSSVLLKLDPDGKFLWYKKLRNAKFSAIDKFGNILACYDYDGHIPNNIVLYDKDYQIKWQKIFYEFGGYAIKNVAFSSTGSVMVDYQNASANDSIFEFDIQGNLLNDYYNTNNTDFYVLTHEKGLFLINQTNNTLPKYNELDLEYFENGNYNYQKITYYTDYLTPNFYPEANAGTALVAEDDNLYGIWNMNTDSINPKPNILHVKYDSISGIGFSNIVIARFSPDSNYLSIKPQFLPNILATVYPNPAIDEIRVQISGASAENRMDIFDVNGQRILSGVNINSSQNIDISSLKSGIYLIKIQNTRGIFYTKFVKVAND